MNKAISTQIAILGGGLVGLTMANLCAEHGFRVALVESKAPTFLNLDEDKNFDIRCSSITPSSENIFRSIGIWDDLVAQRVSFYQKMIVWDGGGFGEICFDAQEMNRSYLGHIIENSIMHRALWEKAISNPLIQLFCPYKSIELCCENNEDKDAKAILKIINENIIDKAMRNGVRDPDLRRQDSLKTGEPLYEDGHQEQSCLYLSAELIIGADGARSWLRAAANIAYTHSNYHQQALIATVKHEDPHQHIAWQRFLPDGPVACLPLSEPNTSSVVWTSSPEKTADQLKLSEIEFCKALAHALDYRLGKVEKAYERLSFPLSKQHAQLYTTNRVALIGDSAHVIHPLAGQGLNLGILDTQALVETLIYGRENKCDLGHPQLLKRYERARQGHNMQMSVAMDFFKNLYGSQNTIVLGLRGVGLNFVNKSHYLKKKIMYFAM